MRSFLVFCFVLLWLHPAWSQARAIQKQDSIISHFLASYNKKEYGSMKKGMFFLGKLLVSKNKMRETFTEIYDNWGKFRIKEIVHVSPTKCEAHVLSEHDTTEIEKFNFFFNKKSRLTGFFIKKAAFTYPKEKEQKTSSGILTDEKRKRIDSLLNKKGSEGNFNGCLLVLDENNAQLKKCIGFGDFENKTRLNDSSVFYLASCSKQFTATAIMILEKEGKLKFTDTVQKFISDFPYKNITIENLLTHTSGLPDYMALLDKYWDKRKQATNNDVLNAFKMHKPKLYFKPGESFDYSNSGYVVLASIIERCSGTSFNKFMAQNIFVPLGMKHTFVGGSSAASGSKIQNWAFGYIYSDSLRRYIIPDHLKEYQFITYLDPVYGDGNINSTIDDLALWEKALRTGNLVPRAILNKAYSKYKLKNGEESDYGYGVCISAGRDIENVIYHSGGWQEYRSFILRLPEKNLSVILLSNNSYVSFNQLVDHITQIILYDRTPQ